MRTAARVVLDSAPLIFFRASAEKLELLNRSLDDTRFTGPQWQELRSGKWQSIVPQEFHSEVQKLLNLTGTNPYVAVEFPLIWSGSTVWLRVLAVAAGRGTRRRLIGLAQDVTTQRQTSSGPELFGVEQETETDAAWSDLCHDINGPLTSILINCDLLLRENLLPGARRRLEAILSDAIRVDLHLRTFRNR